jgi:hypothetical protein
MAFTSGELSVVNQALGRIGSTRISDAENGSDKCNNWAQANLHYSQTRDALLRSYVWNFCSGREVLDKVQTIVLDTEPLPDAWAVGDEITGLASGYTAAIVSVISDSQYEIKWVTGTFVDSESITNGTVEIVFYNGVPLSWENSIVLYETAIGDSYAGDLTVTNSAETIGEWSFQYELPEDILRVKSVYEDDGGDIPSDRYTVEGGRILSSYDSIGLRYVKKVTDTAIFDPLFTDVLILQLALKLLGPLAGNQTTQLRQDLQIELRMPWLEPGR